MAKCTSGGPLRQPLSKPAKPRPDFPMYPHCTRRWAKRIRGKIHYFGSTVADPNGVAALDRWLAVKDALLSGRLPRTPADGDGVRIKDVVNAFLTAKQTAVDAGELSERAFRDYYATCAETVEVFGRERLVSDLNGPDFEKLRAELAKHNGPVRLGNEVQRVRTLFKYGAESGLLNQTVKFGATFKKPSKSVLRRHRAEASSKMFSPEQLRALLDAASEPLRTMILLGLNCAFGNADVGRLRMRAVNLESGWINYPRPKTGIPRRCPLWPETVAALRNWLARRPVPKDLDHKDLVFVTKQRGPWASDKADSPVTKEFAKVLKRLGLAKPGLGFYALRHTFRTKADATRDFPACRAIMGHSDDSMDAAYTEAIDDSRLVAVVEHVRRWLFWDGDRPTIRAVPPLLLADLREGHETE